MTAVGTATRDGDAVVTGSGERTARWVAALVVAGVVLQRFAVPGTEIALLLPVLALWVGFALAHRVVVLDPTRTLLFAASFAATGVAIVAQALWVPDRFLSVGSWALVVATVFPFTCRLVDRRPTTFLLTLRYLVRIGVGLAVLSLVMTASQVAGLAYRDILASVVPPALLLDGFAISYPYSYGSELYRANAWIGLEPSIVSFQLGLAVVAAVLLRRSLTCVALLGIAMVATASGSGFLVVVVGVVVVLVRPSRRVLRRYVAPVAVGVAVLAATPFGGSLLARVGELGTSGSSASLRFSEPYLTLWRPWTEGLGRVLWGDVPGSSQQVVIGTGIDGLLVPTAAKIFFDYGLLAGAVLAAFLLYSYTGSISRSFAVTLFVSLWSIQPGLTTTVLVLPVIALVSLWAPARTLQIEEVEPPISRRPGLARPRPPSARG